jgi:hypothetical protein
MMPLRPLYVPALRKTTSPLGHEAIAEFIWLEVAPGLSVAQMVVRFGIPLRTPALDQSTALEGSMIPDHCCVHAKTGKTNANANNPTPGFQKAILMKGTFPHTTSHKVQGFSAF